MALCFQHLGKRNELSIFWFDKDGRPAHREFPFWKEDMIYNEEFDPGSGWTLATGLTHASRGAAWELLAIPDGDRRTGE